jgi:hypothetical protein
MKNKQSGFTLIEFVCAGILLFALIIVLTASYGSVHAENEKVVADVPIEAKQDLSTCSYVGTSRTNKHVVQCNDDKFFEVE